LRRTLSPIKKGVYTFDHKGFDFRLFLTNIFFVFLRVDSEAKETKEKPLTIGLPVKQSVDLGLFITKLQAKKPTLCSSWGRVNPEALVGRRVCVRMPGEDEFEVLVIKEFNAKDVINTKTLSFVFSSLYAFVHVLLC